MAATKATSWIYCEDFHSEDDTLLHARGQAEHFGSAPVSPSVGALLQVQAAAINATAVVEIGTGTGVSGVWLLRGMSPDGVLTTIDSHAETQRTAKETFRAAGYVASKTRLITGFAAEVLPRLSDHAYDLVFIDADMAEVAGYVGQALRLLRPGGVLLVHSALWQDRIANPARRDPITTGMRETLRALRDDHQIPTTLIPLGDGLLIAVT